MESDSDDGFVDCGVDDHLAEQNFSKLRSGMVKAGYREGYSAGQDAAVQEGFNAGYKVAAGVARTLARMRGIACALLCETQDTDSRVKILSAEEENKLQETVGRISALEKRLATARTSMSASSDQRDEGCKSDNDEAAAAAGAAAAVAAVADAAAGTGKDLDAHVLRDVQEEVERVKQQLNNVLGKIETYSGHAMAHLLE